MDDMQEFDQLVVLRAKQRNDNSVVSMPMTLRNKESLHQFTEDAIANGQDPIKITWKNLSYTVKLSTTKMEKDQGLGKAKQL